MKEIRYYLDEFKLKAFINESISFLKEEGIGGDNPISAISVVYDDGSTSNFDDSIAEKDLVKELVNEKKSLYFHFTNTNIEESMLCADGNEYIINSSDEEEELENTFLLGYMETAGFLVQVIGDYITINIAKYFIGGCMLPPCVNIVEEEGEFGTSMRDFINKFKR